MPARLEPCDSDPGCLIIHIEDSIDYYNAERFKESIGNIADSGITRLILACSKMRYISQDGIFALYCLLLDMKRRGCDLAMASVHPRIRGILALFGFGRLVDFHSDLGSALGETRETGSWITRFRATTFPTALACPGCSRRLKTLRSGTFICGGCGRRIYCSPDGGLIVRPMDAPADILLPRKARSTP